MSDHTPATNLINQILLEIPKRWPGARAWRRNVGGAVGMNTVKSAIELLRAGKVGEAIKMLQRPVRFGLPGEADIDGFIPINGYAVRTAVEIKIGRDKLSEQQVHFRDMLLRAGGIWIEARDLAQALRDIEFHVGIARKRGEPVK